MRQKYLLSVVFLLAVSLGMNGQSEKKNFLLGKGAFAKKESKEERIRKSSAEVSLRAGTDYEDDVHEYWWNSYYPQLLDSHVEYDEAGKVTYREVSTYDEQGYLLKIEGEYMTPIYEEEFNLYLTKLKAEITYNNSKTGYERLISYLHPHTGKWVAAHKMVEEYNKSGYLLLEEGYKIDATTNSLIPDRKAEYVYNDRNDRTLRISNDWNATTNSWDESGRLETEYTYDSKGYMTSRTDYDYVDGVCLSKDKMAYDEEGNTILYENYNWNKENQEWKGYYKTEERWDKYDNVVFYADYEWDETNKTWVCHNKREETYDDQGRQTSRRWYEWNYTTNELQGSWGAEDVTYDSQDRVTLEINYEWDTEIKSWIPESKSEFDFDNDGNAVFNADYYWDKYSNDWVGEDKFESNYNDKGDQTLYISYEWDASSKTWRDVYKSQHEYTYGNSGELSLDTYSSWNYETNSWVVSSITKYDITSNNGVYTRIASEWIDKTSSWKGFYKEEYALDNLGNKTLDASYYWGYNGDTDQDEWVGQEKYEQKYDSRGNILLKTRYLWEGNQWSEVSMREYAYDSRDNLTLSISLSDWNVDTNNWDRGDKVEWIVDERGIPYLLENKTWHYDNICTSVIRSKWDSATGSWIVEEKQERAFDDEFRTTLDISFTCWNGEWSGHKYEYAYLENGKEKLYARYIWDDTTKNWIVKSLNEKNSYGNTVRSIYNSEGGYEEYRNFFSDRTVAIEPITDISSRRIYPNPTTEGFFVDGLTEDALLTLLDLNGTLCLSQTVSEGDYISIAHLPKGIYVINVEKNSTKLIIK